MVVARNKYPEKFAWGEEDQFHTLECDGNQFELLTPVNITTKDGKTRKCSIGYIDTDTIQTIRYSDMADEDIKLEDIVSISYC